MNDSKCKECNWTKGSKHCENCKDYDKFEPEFPIDVMDIGGNNHDLLEVIQILIQQECKEDISSDCEPFYMCTDEKFVSYQIKELLTFLEKRQEEKEVSRK